MTQPGAAGSSSSGNGEYDWGALGGLRAEGREPGARRKKLAGYLKAASELRQSYRESYGPQWANKDPSSKEVDDGTPGAFPDAAVVRNGDEEMVLFPSYARKHVKNKPKAIPGTIQEVPGTGRDIRDSAGAGDAEFWKQEWEKYEDDNAVVDMSAAELAVANSHLMARLKPFLANPLANTPISAFFYNDSVSRQRTINTNSSGHFSIRAALDFVPTHVRILASEKLSATEEVIITDPNGVSLISDIDDTIKHSAIGSGAREIFRNAFIRDLGDLTIEGVREWYTRMANMGVKIHYVSNSPWQLYPVLTSFFAMAGLPPGSFHLKQYSGMLQGIFEPVAERKKGTLDKIMRDFPERRFVLVGDSGEADLEVYTDVVLENPGRILGVFIRDVTTPVPKNFFDSSMGALSGDRPMKQSSRNGSTHNLNNAKRFSMPHEDEDDPDVKAAIASSLRDFEMQNHHRLRDVQKQNKNYAASLPSSRVASHSIEKRPELPPRRVTEPPAPEAQNMEAGVGDLIDFGEDESTAWQSISSPVSRATTDTDDGTPEKRG
ncbi:hypothetical protein LTR39_000757, partial [Cryomyces antarcticus]